MLEASSMTLMHDLGQLNGLDGFLLCFLLILIFILNAEPHIDVRWVPGAVALTLPTLMHATDR